MNGRKILDGLSLTMGDREIHALLGANGSGKTTLACVIMGCQGYRAESGQVLFVGTDLGPLALHERARLGLTMGWQEPARFEGLTVRQYLTAGRPGADPAPHLERVGLAPERYLDRYVDKPLSGGERQRIELAAVSLTAPRLAILDEPAAGIDVLSLDHVMNVIRTLKEQGSSVLLITHLEDVALTADRASQLCGGRILCSGTPQKVVAHYRQRTGVRCDGEICADVGP